MAGVFAWRGESDLAFEWLDIAFEQHSAFFAFLLINRNLHSLESDPRYPVLLEKIGLLTYWETMPKLGEEVKP